MEQKCYIHLYKIPHTAGKAVSDNNRLADKTDRNNPPVIFNKPASVQLQFPPSFGQIEAAWINAAAPR